MHGFIIDLTYTQLKAIIIQKGLFWQYVEDDIKYDIFAVDLNVKYDATVWKAGFEPLGDTTQNTNNRNDFETNFKASANKRLTNQSAMPVFIRKEIPPGATKVRSTARSNMTGSSDTDYVIPNGQQLVITEFQVASALAAGVVVSNRIELYFDPNGNGTGMILLLTLYTAASNHNLEINEMFTGNGTRNVKIRRTALGTGAREVYAQWEGFLQ